MGAIVDYHPYRLRDMGRFRATLPAVTLHLGDCTEVLARLGDASVHAVVTDPPAGIGFMGREWDGDKGGRYEWIEWMAHVMWECLRVLKPGGHALVWALPRVSHRTATAIEDAGFEIRDVVVHIFGSGFPKGIDVSKAIDRLHGAERAVVGSKVTGNARTGDGWAGGQMTVDLTAPATDDAKQWDGWNAALKPSNEHWILARKPLEGSVARNVLEHGTGAINVGACRVGTDTITTKIEPEFLPMFREKGVRDKRERSQTEHIGRWPPNTLFTHAPDCAEQCVESCPIRELDRQSGVSSASGGPIEARPETQQPIARSGILTRDDHTSHRHIDSGGASRFFPRFKYQAKPAVSEKDAGLDGFAGQDGAERSGRKPGSAGVDHPRGNARGGQRANIHPTVKSVDLMRWLVRLVCPEGGTVLDPFMGSGTTGVAAVAEQMAFVGIEQDERSYQAARARIEHAQCSPVHEASDDVPERPLKVQQTLFG